MWLHPPSLSWNPSTSEVSRVQLASANSPHLLRGVLPLHPSIWTASCFCLAGACPSGKDRFPILGLLESLPLGFREPEGGDKPPTRSGGAAREPTQTSAALTSGRGCRPRASARSPTGSCFWATRSHHRALIPHANGDCEMRKRRKLVSQWQACPRSGFRAEFWLQAWVSDTFSSPGMLCWAPCAPLLGWAVSVQLAVLVHARTAALSPSSRGDDFQFTWRLARIPRGRASWQRVQRRGRCAGALAARVRLQHPPRRRRGAHSRLQPLSSGLQSWRHLPSLPPHRGAAAAEGGVPRARTRECECVCVHASLCPAGLGTDRNRSWIQIRALGKAVPRGYCEQLGALASRLGLSLGEPRRKRLR